MSLLLLFAGGGGPPPLFVYGTIEGPVTTAKVRSEFSASVTGSTQTATIRNDDDGTIKGPSTGSIN